MNAKKLLFLMVLLIFSLHVRCASSSSSSSGPASLNERTHCFLEIAERTRGLSDQAFRAMIDQFQDISIQFARSQRLIGDAEPRLLVQAPAFDDELGSFLPAMQGANVDNVVDLNNENPTKMIELPVAMTSGDGAAIEEFLDRESAVKKCQDLNSCHTPIMTSDRRMSAASRCGLTVVECSGEKVLAKALYVPGKPLLYALPTLTSRNVEGEEKTIEDIVYMLPVDKNGSMIRLKPLPNGADAVSCIGIYSELTGEMVQKVPVTELHAISSREALCKACFRRFIVEPAKNF